MTAAVRDLHICYPHRFITGVSTRCPELWEHNSYVTRLSTADPDIETIECSYPLIDHANETPYHCLHGFVDFLNRRLGLNIRPTAFKGDIHLSDQEKAWFSQICELTGKDLPFWIVAAGGKYDIPIKWWNTQRYQEVVNSFRGRIQFVQVGDWGNHHPRLEGVIDLRGRTDLRQLVRLVYHAQGVLCPVTSLMHLAAAVAIKHPRLGPRPCVVVAGGREPAHWEAYPNHQFIHTNGALPCCSRGGCWKDRYEPLGDGDKRDAPGHRCFHVAHGLPECMDLITAAEVVRRIELYFEGGARRYLTPAQAKLAQKAVTATRRHRFDQQPLSLSSARLALRGRLATLPEYPRTLAGRGIVICGGGPRYFPSAWVCIHMLRHLNCSLPIQLWYLGEREMTAEMRALVEPLGVVCVDALQVRKRHPARILRGWELKPYAILHSPFEQVLLLDADNVPVRDPEYLFASPPFRNHGAVFWPDFGRSNRANPIWRSCGLAVPKGPEFESGQVLVDKSRCWQALSLCMWFNENSDFYFQHLHGDKDTFHLAFACMRLPFALVNIPIKALKGTMCQHDFDGHRIFQHRNTLKWTLDGRNSRVPGFLYETECLAFLRRLRRRWWSGA